MDALQLATMAFTLTYPVSDPSLGWVSFLFPGHVLFVMQLEYLEISFKYFTVNISFFQITSTSFRIMLILGTSAKRSCQNPY